MPVNKELVVAIVEVLIIFRVGLRSSRVDKAVRAQEIIKREMMNNKATKSSYIRNCYARMMFKEMDSNTIMLVDRGFINFLLFNVIPVIATKKEIDIAYSWRNAIIRTTGLDR